MVDGMLLNLTGWHQGKERYFASAMCGGCCWTLQVARCGHGRNTYETSGIRTYSTCIVPVCASFSSSSSIGVPPPASISDSFHNHNPNPIPRPIPRPSGRDDQLYRSRKAHFRRYSASLRFPVPPRHLSSSDHLSIRLAIP